MGLHKEVRASRLTNRIVQHGCSLSELQEKLRAVDSPLPFVISRPSSKKGRVI